MSRVAWRVSRGVWRVSRGVWSMSRGAWRVSRGAWRVERRDSVELLTRAANTLSDVAICEGNCLYMEGCGWGGRGG